MNKYDQIKTCNCYFSLIFYFFIICDGLISVQEFSRFHPQITPMLDGILNNRKEWNAKKEEYEANLKAMEDEKAAKESNATTKGAVILYHQTFHLTFRNILSFFFFNLCILCPPAAANNPGAGGSGSKTCTVC